MNPPYAVIEQVSFWYRWVLIDPTGKRIATQASWSTASDEASRELDQFLDAINWTRQ